ELDLRYESRPVPPAPGSRHGVMTTHEMIAAVTSDWRLTAAASGGLALTLAAVLVSLRARRLAAAPDPLLRAVLWQAPGLPPGAQPRRSVTERRSQTRWSARSITVTVADPTEAEVYGIAIVADRSA